MMLSFALGTVLPTCQTAKVRGVALWVGGQSHASYSTPFQSSPTPHLPGQPTLVSACLCPSAGVPGEEKDGRLWKRETGWGVARGPPSRPSLCLCLELRGPERAPAGTEEHREHGTLRGPAGHRPPQLRPHPQHGLRTPWEEHLLQGGGLLPLPCEECGPGLQGPTGDDRGSHSLLHAPFPACRVT